MFADSNRVATRIEEMKSKRRIEEFLCIPTTLITQYAQSSAEQRYFTEISEAATCLEEIYGSIKSQMAEWTQLVHDYVDWQAEVELGRATLTKLPSEEINIHTRSLVTRIDEYKASLYVSLERTRSIYDTLYNLRAKADDFIATNNNFITTLQSHNVIRLPQQYRVLVHMYTEMKRRLDILLEMAASAQSHKLGSESTGIDKCVQWTELIISFAENEGATPPIALTSESQKSEQASSPVMRPASSDVSSPRETSPQVDSASVSLSIKRKHAEISFAPEEGRAHLTQKKRTRMKYSSSPVASPSEELSPSNARSLSKNDFDVFDDGTPSKEKAGSSLAKSPDPNKGHDGEDVFKDSSNSVEEKSISSAPELSLHLKEIAKAGKENTSQEDIDGSSGASTQLSADLNTKAPVSNVITRTAVSLLRANTK